MMREIIKARTAPPSGGLNNSTESDLRGQNSLGRVHSGWRNLKPWEAYVFALVVTAITIGLRLAFDDARGGQPRLGIFTIPIMLSAYAGGLRAGLLATATSWLATSYYLLPPLHSFAVASPSDQWLLLFFALAGVLISVLNEALHRTRLRADQISKEHVQVQRDLAKASPTFSASSTGTAAASGRRASWEAAPLLAFLFPNNPRRPE